MYTEWAERFRVLGDATRLRILSLLSVRDACVCELVELLPITQPAVSQHLRKLKLAGLVDEYRVKSWRFYRLQADMPPYIASWIQELKVGDSDIVWLKTHQVGATCTINKSARVNSTDDEVGMLDETDDHR